MQMDGMVDCLSCFPIACVPSLGQIRQQSAFSPVVNTYPFCGLFHVSSARLLAVCEWFCYLTWPSSIVPKCFVLCPGRKSMWGALWEKYTLDTHVSDGTVGLNPMLMSQHCLIQHCLISGVSLNRSKCMVGFFIDGCHKIHLTKAWRNVAGITPPPTVVQHLPGEVWDDFTEHDFLRGWELTVQSDEGVKQVFSIWEHLAEIMWKDHWHLVCVFTQSQYHTGGWIWEFRVSLQTGYYGLDVCFSSYSYTEILTSEVRVQKGPSKGDLALWVKPLGMKLVPL